MQKYVVPLMSLAAGLGLAALLWAARPDAAPAHPNVLIVLWDTVRADRLSLYGYDLATTPRMKAWATKHGIVYEQAISPAMWTVPAHASIFTGLHPSSHGAGFDHRWLDDHNLTMAEHFGEHGYDTYAFSANPNLSPARVNLLQGFEHVDVAWSPEWRRKVQAHTRGKLIPEDRSTEISPGNPNRQRGTGFYNAGPVTRAAFTRWLDQREDPDRPFFAYLSYMEAHKPRVPTREHREAVADDDLVRVGLETDLTFESQLLFSYGKKRYSPEELEAVNRVYDASLLDLDEATGALLDDLARRGILDDTIVVFTSDHGEQLGDHDQFGHRSGVFQALVHVPLVIAWPERLKPRRESRPVSTIALFDTLTRLTGVTRPTDLVPHGDLTEPGRLPDAVITESISIDRLGFGKVRKLHPDVTRDTWANLYRAVISGDRKLIRTVDFDTREPIAEAAYDLAADPHEQAPSTAAPEDLVARLDRWWDEVPKWDSTRADVVRNAEDEGGAQAAALRKQLEMLGYVTEEAPASAEEDDSPEGEPSLDE